MWFPGEARELRPAEFQSLSLWFPTERVKKVPAHAEDAGVTALIPGLGRFPGEGNGNPLQYSCLENTMDRGAWQATVHGVRHN